MHERHPVEEVVMRHFRSIPVFSILTFEIDFQGICAWYAYGRYKQGVDSAFAPNYEADAGGVGAPYSYPGAPDPIGGYQEPPFSGVESKRKA